MRKRVHGQALAVQAIAGNGVVLFGMDLDSGALEGFRGFALERTDHTENERYWLKNLMCFEHNDVSAQTEMPMYSTLENPVQAFLWGDYTAKPAHDYTYGVHAMYGAAKNLSSRSAVDIRVQTTDPVGEPHAVFFNRGAAASQGYARLFHDARPDDVPNRRALTWLSRGLYEALIDFIDSAQAGDALHAAVYELQYPEVLAAFKRAAARKADVQIIYDAVPGKATKTDNLKAIKTAGISKLTIPRANSKYIAHNKFIVLSKAGKPARVWTGSTNLTEGGVFGHSNVGHRITDANLARTYLAYWKTLAGDPGAPPLKEWNDAHSPLPDFKAALTPVFSPRSTVAALDAYAGRFEQAKRAAFFTAPFGVDKRLQAIFAKRSDTLRYVIEDTGRNGIEVTNRSPNNRIAIGAQIASGGFAQWVKEKLSGLNKHAVYIHTKYMLLDPLAENGTVISGSANFSEASIIRNDENAITVVGDGYVNDVYLTEFMRLFSHYAFRAAVKKTPAAKDARSKSTIYLKDDDKWYKRFYKAGSPEEKERRYFSGS